MSASPAPQPAPPSRDRSRRRISYFVVAAAALVAGAILTGTLNLTPRASAKKRDPAVPAATVTIPSFADIAQAALPSVVSITSTEMVKESEQSSPFQGDPFEFFFGPRRRTPGGGEGEHKQVEGGSGFIISDSGEILTNNHVVEGAQKIQVRLQDREVLTAKIAGTDPATDLALLKVSPHSKLRPITLGDSDKLRVGDWVMAIGNPMTFEGTVTVGVVSAKQRSGLSEDVNAASLQDFIQTDAAINFGNSGGPLVDVSGRVVGLTTMIVRPAQNIGFAVPINIAKQILPQLRQHGKVTRGLLGVNVGNVDQDIQQAFHLPSLDGAFVQSVDPNMPAAKAGLKPGDTIVRVDDTPVKTTRDLIDYVSSRPPGQKVRLTLLRESRTVTTTVTLGERETTPSSSARPSSYREGAGGDGAGKLGIEAAELTPDVRRELGIGPSIAGVVVEGVQEVSPAADQGLTTGDVITEVNGKPVRSVAELHDAVSKVKKGDYVRLYVRRFVPQQVSRYVLIQVE